MAMRRVARQKDGSLLIAARHALPHAPLGGPARLVERRHIVESADIALERLAGFLKAGFVGLAVVADQDAVIGAGRSEEHTSELQSLMRISYAVFCLKKKTK